MRKLLVWDWPTRLFHWLAVVLVTAAYVTYRLNWMDWHAWAGETLLALVLFRVVWGFCGSDTARFARFLAPPRAAVAHLRHALRREPDRQVGHNAAGGWMVLLLMVLLLAETVDGVFVNNEVANEGWLSAIVPAPVSNLMTDLHQVLWYALCAAVGLHLLAIALYAAIKGQNLVTPMVTGRKSLPPGVRSPRIVGAGRALLVLGCSALATAAFVYLV